ncbi:MAG: alpha/beta fold hydrolase [Acidimicrobiales bacterium]
MSLAVSEWGNPDAPCVVLVHGYPDTSAVWSPLAELLAARFHVVASEGRGAGASDAPARTADYEVSLLVRDLSAVIDACANGRAHVVGHDWGSVQTWHAVADPGASTRIASFTSISGLSLGHAGRWVRLQLARGVRGVPAIAAQGMRSSYVAMFHLPGLPRVVEALARRDTQGKLRRAWAHALAWREGARTDDDWPAPTFGRDMARGMELYRANVGRHLRGAATTRTDVPVQLVVAQCDRYVPPSFLSGLEREAQTVWRREVEGAGHWLIRTHVDDLASWVQEVVEHVEGGPEPAALSVLRLVAAPA